MPSHLDLGKEGENTAAQYLEAQGYDIRERNVRFKHDEIDIIAYDKAEKMIVFVEVKTRSSYSRAYPISSAVTAAKRHKLRRAISKWITQQNYEGAGRTDILCVCDGNIVDHIKNIGSDFW